jgi:hypothetical protein
MGVPDDRCSMDVQGDLPMDVQGDLPMDVQGDLYWLGELYWLGDLDALVSRLPMAKSIQCFLLYNLQLPLRNKLQQL